MATETITRPGAVLPVIVRTARRQTCSLGDGKPAKGRGLCSMHYSRWKRHGDPLTVKVILGESVESRLEVKVDRSAGPIACHPFRGALDDNGYGQMYEHRRSRRAHVVAWEKANGQPVPSGYHVDHECHNEAARVGACTPGPCRHRSCCNPLHLVARPARDHCLGQSSGKAIFSDDDIRVVRQALRDGASMVELARRYGVSPKTIQTIKKRRKWAHVPDFDEIPAGLYAQAVQQIELQYSKAVAEAKRVRGEALDALVASFERGPGKD
jgi:transposase-like protein